LDAPEETPGRRSKTEREDDESGVSQDVGISQLDQQDLLDAQDRGDYRHDAQRPPLPNHASGLEAH